MSISLQHFVRVPTLACGYLRLVCLLHALLRVCVSSAAPPFLRELRCPTQPAAGITWQQDVTGPARVLDGITLFTYDAPGEWPHALPSHATRQEVFAAGSVRVHLRNGVRGDVLAGTGNGFDAIDFVWSPGDAANDPRLTLTWSEPGRYYSTEAIQAALSRVTFHHAGRNPTSYGTASTRTLRLELMADTAAGHEEFVQECEFTLQRALLPPALRFVNASGQPCASGSVTPAATLQYPIAAPYEDAPSVPVAVNATFGNVSCAPTLDDDDSLEFSELTIWLSPNVCLEHNYRLRLSQSHTSAVHSAWIVSGRSDDAGSSVAAQACRASIPLIAPIGQENAWPTCCLHTIASTPGAPLGGRSYVQTLLHHVALQASTTVSRPARLVEVSARIRDVEGRLSNPLLLSRVFVPEHVVPPDLELVARGAGGNAVPCAAVAAAAAYRPVPIIPETCHLTVLNSQELQSAVCRCANITLNATSSRLALLPTGEAPKMWPPTGGTVYVSDDAHAPGSTASAQRAAGDGRVPVGWQWTPATQMLSIQAVLPCPVFAAFISDSLSVLHSPALPEPMQGLNISVTLAAEIFRQRQDLRVQSDLQPRAGYLARDSPQSAATGLRWSRPVYVPATLAEFVSPLVIERQDQRTFIEVNTLDGDMKLVGGRHRVVNAFATAVTQSDVRFTLSRCDVTCAGAAGPAQPCPLGIPADAGDLFILDAQALRNCAGAFVEIRACVDDGARCVSLQTSVPVLHITEQGTRNLAVRRSWVPQGGTLEADVQASASDDVAAARAWLMRANATMLSNASGHGPATLSFQKLLAAYEGAQVVYAVHNDALAICIDPSENFGVRAFGEGLLRWQLDELVAAVDAWAYDSAANAFTRRKVVALSATLVTASNVEAWLARFVDGLGFIWRSIRPDGTDENGAGASGSLLAVLAQIVSADAHAGLLCMNGILPGVTEDSHMSWAAMPSASGGAPAGNLAWPSIVPLSVQIRARDPSLSVTAAWEARLWLRIVRGGCTLPVAAAQPCLANAAHACINRCVDTNADGNCDVSLQGGADANPDGTYDAAATVPRPVCLLPPRGIQRVAGGTNARVYVPSIAAPNTPAAYLDIPAGALAMGSDTVDAHLRLAALTWPSWVMLQPSHGFVLDERMRMKTGVLVYAVHSSHPGVFSSLSDALPAELCVTLPPSRAFDRMLDAQQPRLTLLATWRRNVSAPLILDAATLAMTTRGVMQQPAPDVSATWLPASGYQPWQPVPHSWYDAQRRAVCAFVHRVPDLVTVGRRSASDDGIGVVVEHIHGGIPGARNVELAKAIARTTAFATLCSASESDAAPPLFDDSVLPGTTLADARQCIEQLVEAEELLRVREDLNNPCVHNHDALIMMPGSAAWWVSAGAAVLRSVPFRSAGSENSRLLAFGVAEEGTPSWMVSALSASQTALSGQSPRVLQSPACFMHVGDIEVCVADEADGGRRLFELPLWAGRFDPSRFPGRIARAVRSLPRHTQVVAAAATARALVLITETLRENLDVVGAMNAEMLDTRELVVLAPFPAPMSTIERDATRHSALPLPPSQLLLYRPSRVIAQRYLTTWHVGESAWCDERFGTRGWAMPEHIREAYAVDVRDGLLLDAGHAEEPTPLLTRTVNAELDEAHAHVLIVAEARDGNNPLGRELWHWHIASAPRQRAELVADLAPGSLSSDADDFFGYRGHAIFTAYTGQDSLRHVLAFDLLAHRVYPIEGATASVSMPTFGGHVRPVFTAFAGFIYFIHAQLHASTFRLQRALVVTACGVSGPRLVVAGVELVDEFVSPTSLAVSGGRLWFVCKRTPSSVILDGNPAVSVYLADALCWTDGAAAPAVVLPSAEFLGKLAPSLPASVNTRDSSVRVISLQRDPQHPSAVIGLLRAEAVAALPSPPTDAVTGRTAALLYDALQNTCSSSQEPTASVSCTIGEVVQSLRSNTFAESTILLVVRVSAGQLRLDERVNALPPSQATVTSVKACDASSAGMSLKLGRACAKLWPGVPTEDAGTRVIAFASAPISTARRAVQAMPGPAERITRAATAQDMAWPFDPNAFTPTSISPPEDTSEGHIVVTAAVRPNEAALNAAGTDCAEMSLELYAWRIESPTATTLAKPSVAAQRSRLWWTFRVPIPSCTDTQADGLVSVRARGQHVLVALAKQAYLIKFNLLGRPSPRVLIDLTAEVDDVDIRAPAGPDSVRNADTADAASFTDAATIHEVLQAQSANPNAAVRVELHDETLAIAVTDASVNLVAVRDLGLAGSLAVDSAASPTAHGGMVIVYSERQSQWHRVQVLTIADMALIPLQQASNIYTADAEFGCSLAFASARLLAVAACGIRMQAGIILVYAEQVQGHARTWVPTHAMTPLDSMTGMPLWLPGARFGEHMAAMHGFIVAGRTTACLGWPDSNDAGVMAPLYWEQWPSQVDYGQVCGAALHVFSLELETGVVATATTQQLPVDGADTTVGSAAIRRYPALKDVAFSAASGATFASVVHKQHASAPRRTAVYLYEPVPVHTGNQMHETPQNAPPSYSASRMRAWTWSYRGEAAAQSGLTRSATVLAPPSFMTATPRLAADNELALILGADGRIARLRCTPAAVCAQLPGHFATMPCSFADAQGCRPCSGGPCPTGTHEVAPCSAGGDRVCSPPGPAVASPTDAQPLDEVKRGYLGGLLRDGVAADEMASAVRSLG